MPKSFIYSARNYCNRKEPDGEDGTIPGPKFHSGILTRSGKLNEQQANGVPWNLEAHFQYYFPKYHQPGAKVRWGTSSNGSSNIRNSGTSTAKDRERKRRAKSKLKSFHHLSLVTRFQLGLRMSRLRSKQRASCVENGLNRTNITLGIGNDIQRINGDGLCRKLQEDNEFIDQRYCNVGKDKTISSPDPEHLGIYAGLQRKQTQKESSTSNKVTEHGEHGEHLHETDVDKFPNETKANENNNHFFLKEHKVIKTSLDKNSIQNRETQASNIPYRVIDIESNFTEKSSNLFCEMSRPCEDELPLDNEEPNENELTMEGDLTEVASVPPKRSGSLDNRRPKIVITLSGTKPSDGDRQSADVKLNNLKKTNDTTALNVGLKNDLPTPPNPICNESPTYSNGSNLINLSPSFESCQLVYVPTKALPSQLENTTRDDFVSSTFIYNPNRTSTESTYSLTEPITEIGSNSKEAQVINSSTEDLNATPCGDESTESINKVPRGSIVFVLKPNSNDEMEPSLALHDNVPEKSNEVASNKESFRTTVGKKSEVEICKQRKIIIAYNKMLWKSNLLNDIHGTGYALDMSSSEVHAENTADGLSLDTTENCERTESPNEDKYTPMGSNTLCIHTERQKEMESDQLNLEKSEKLPNKNSSYLISEYINGSFKNTEKFQRITAMYNQECCNKNTVAVSRDTQTQPSRDNKPQGTLYNISKPSIENTPSSALNSFYHQRSEPPLHRIMFGVPNITPLNPDPLMKSINHLNTSQTTSSNTTGSHNAGDNRSHPLNSSQIVLVPPSNVFTVTQSNLCYGNQYNRLALADNEAVSGSNRHLGFLGQNIDNKEMSSRNDTNVVLSNETKKDTGCDKHTAKSSYCPPQKDIISGVVDLPCDYKIPIRKETLASDDNSFTRGASKTASLDSNHRTSVSDGRLSQQYEAAGMKSALQNVTKALLNTKTANIGNTENTTKMNIIPSIDNFIGWVPVKLPDINGKAQVPTLFIPSQGANTNSEQTDILPIHFKTVMKATKTPQVLQNTASPPINLAYKVVNQSEKEILTSAPKPATTVPNVSNPHRGNTTPLPAKTSTNAAILSGCVPLQLSWSSVLSNSESADHKNAKSSMGFWTRQQNSKTFNLVDQKPEEISQKPQTSVVVTQTTQTTTYASNIQEITNNAIEIAETLKFATQKPESAMFTTQTTETASFATPAADLLSSVARVPILQYNVKNLPNHFQGNIFKNADAPSATMDNLELSFPPGTSRYPEGMGKGGVTNKQRMQNETYQDLRDTNMFYNSEQTSSSQIHDKNEPWNALHGKKRKWIGNRIIECNRYDYNLSNFVKKQKTEAISIKKPVETGHVHNPQLVLLADHNSCDGSSKMSIGILHPISGKKIEAYESGLKQDGGSFKSTTSTSNTSLIQSVDKPRLSENVTPSMYTGWKISQDSPADMRVNTMTPPIGSVDRPTQLYVANPFFVDEKRKGGQEDKGEEEAGGDGGDGRGGGGGGGDGGGGGTGGGQSNPWSIYSTAAQYKASQGITTKITSDDLNSVVTDLSKNDSTTAFLWETPTERQTCYMRQANIEKLPSEELEGEKVVAGEINLFCKNVSYTLPGLCPTIGRVVLNAKTNGETKEFTRGEFSIKKGQEQDLTPQISTMPFAICAPTMLKAYTISCSKGDISSSSSMNSNISASNNSNSVCPICYRRFTRPWLLKGHMRTHTGERPFQCSFPSCDKAFADKSNLRSHMQTHTAVTKNFECTQCGRAFSQKRYLHKHTMEVCKFGNR